MSVGLWDTTSIMKRPVDQFYYQGTGFKPLFVSSGWQVSQLNDCEELHSDTVDRIERHDGTDEVFLLVCGKATLVTATKPDGQHQFELVQMEQGVTYNIPSGTWHTIITSPGMQVMIVEKDQTHLNDVTYCALTDSERAALRAKLEGAKNA
jgi:ureidoglycolate hydrolase